MYSPIFKEHSDIEMHTHSWALSDMRKNALSQRKPNVKSTRVFGWINRTESVRHVMSIVTKQSINIINIMFCYKIGKTTTENQAIFYGTGSWNLFQDNAWPHTAVCERNFADKRPVATLDHPLYSLDLSPRDFFLFSPFKRVPKALHFANVPEIQPRVTSKLRPIPETGM